MPISRLIHRNTRPPYKEEAIYDDASYETKENTFVEPVADVVNEAGEGEQVQTDFSLPEDMAEEIVEPDLFDDPFDATEPEATIEASERAMEELPDAPVFEAGDMPGQTTTPPPQPQSQPAPVQATPTPEPPKQEQKSGASAAPPEASDAVTPSSGEDDKDGATLRQFDASDMEMALITEDLIELLIGRNFINFANFPNMVQAKLINRRALRSNMSALTNLVSDEENIF